MAQLGEQAGVDPGFLAYIETGKKMPSLPTAAKLAAALGIRLSDLFQNVPGEHADHDYQSERQVMALLHGLTREQKKAMLAILKGLRNPKRLEALQQLIRR
jgi:DNA-binding XRE family transcriptional regulator